MRVRKAERLIDKYARELADDILNNIISQEVPAYEDNLTREQIVHALTNFAGEIINLVKAEVITEIRRKKKA